MAVWKDLFPELLALTAKRLTSVLDYNSFRGVCKSWRSAATFDNFDSSFPQVPWFMFNESHKHKFLNLSNNQKFTTPNLPIPPEIPDSYYLSCVVSQEIYDSYYLSCRGWLLHVAENDASLYLSHPIRPNRIQLPNWDNFPRCTVREYSWRVISRIALSGSPTIVSDLVVMVIWCFHDEEKQLAFSRPGDSCWTLMEHWDCSFEDIIYHKDKFYAMDDIGRMVECDIHGKNPTQMRIILSIPHFFGWHNSCYMVESSGKLLIVDVHYRIFEFDLMDRSCKVIYDLGNRTLFVSPDSSTLCVEGFAWNDEVQPNCIYDAHRGYCCGISDKDYIKDFFKERGPRRWIIPGF